MANTTMFSITALCNGAMWLSLCMLVNNINATIDLNIHEIQYVADHLTDLECRKLAEALHQRTFRILKPVSGSHEPQKSCMYLLVRWDRTEGKGKTFNDLALRLRQIGRGDVADKLSKTVYHEKSEAVKESFKGENSFKKMVPKDSFLLDTSDIRTTIMPMAADDTQTLSSWQIFVLVCGCLCVIVLPVFIVRFCFPNESSKLWSMLAPESAVDGCELCCEECQRCCIRFQKHFFKYTIGSKPLQDDDMFVFS